MTEKQECFLCKRNFFIDDPEYNAERRICDSCAGELEQDNLYNARLDDWYIQSTKGKIGIANENE